MNEYIRLTK